MSARLERKMAVFVPLPHLLETGRLLIFEKRMPFAGGLLIAASMLALAGCATDKRALDSAAAAVPADQTASPLLAANTPAKPASNSAYRDPMVNNVSGTQQAAAQDPNASAMPPGSTAMAPANIGGLAMQSTGINAQTISIFSARSTLPQNNGTSTIIQPSDANAYLPVQGVSPTRSSVYSSPPAPNQAPQQGVPLLPQQSSQNTGIEIAPAETASLTSGGIQSQTMSALYSAPKANLLDNLSNLLHKASLPGMTRVAPNGLHIQNDKVEVGCFKPNLLNVINTVETHFGKPVIVTSGYRDPDHNRVVGGAEESLHKSCDAADIQIDGVSKWDIATYIRSLPDRGGVGTYCHTDSVHLDTGNSRDWNWGCGGKAAPKAIARAI